MPSNGPLTDIEIARAAHMRPIADIGAKLGISQDALLPYGHTKAKIGYDFINGLAERPNGKLILVTAITPTPAGEGKTTTTVGLGDGLNRIGKNAAICLREPSLGPCFGMKGGAAGGGYAQVVPMEDINLHFTGDFHAVGSANNLLAAMLDNHLHWGNDLGIDFAPYRLAARRGYERPRPARHRRVAGRHGQWLSARRRFRHHGGLGNHGDLLPGRQLKRFANPPRQHGRGPDAPPPARHRQGLERRRRHDRVA